HFCLEPAPLPSELRARSSKRFSPFFNGLPVFASILRSSLAAASFSPLAAALPFSVGASLTPIVMISNARARIRAARLPTRSPRRVFHTLHMRQDFAHFRGYKRGIICL